MFVFVKKKKFLFDSFFRSFLDLKNKNGVDHSFPSRIKPNERCTGQESYGTIGIGY